MIRPVLRSFLMALRSQLHIRMLLLTIAPFLLSISIWGLVLYFTLQPMIDWLQAYFAGYDLFREVSGWLNAFDAGFASYVVVPLVAMWVLLPLMILTALLFIALFAMPAIVRHVASRHYPQLEQRQGGSIWGSMWMSFYTFILFVVLWIVSLPLLFLPPLGVIVQAVLWGWLTYKVLAYDALSEHADREELRELQRRQRWPLLLIGTVTGALGAAPMLLWLGGIMGAALSLVLFPLFAAVSIWLYVLVFVFTGLWFTHFCLAALAEMRVGSASATATTVQFKDINQL